LRYRLVIFKTSRLTVRRLASKDIDELKPILSDQLTMQYTAHGALDVEQSAKFIEDCLYQYSSTGFGHWVMVNTETQDLIGLCGLNLHEVDSMECLHVNYRLGTKYHGKGFATEAVNGVIDYCTKRLARNSLFAIIAPTNWQSIKVIERTGFHFVKRTKFKDLDVNIYQLQLPLIADVS
jgi:[ribosomal protein S5]-alanine N-acetyltransferase